LLLAGVLSITCLGGCDQPGLGATPITFRADGAYAAAVPEANRTLESRLLFATDRKERPNAAPASRYGAQRATTLTLGAATVGIGTSSWDWAKVCSTTEAGKDISLRVLDIEEFGVLPSTVPLRQDAETRPPVDGRTAFCEAVNASLTAGGEPTITVFVHGFNTSFRDALMFCTSLWHHSARRGVVIAYTWPAHDHPFNYPTDRESGGLTARALREFLLMLAQHTDAERINLFTYSAGAPTVVAALHQMRLIFADEFEEKIQEATKLEEVVFAGADVDIDALRIAGLDRTQDVAERVTIYSSRIDVGVALSNTFYFNRPRLGRADRLVTPEQRETLRDAAEINVIDVTLAQRRAGRGDLYAHGYWHGNAWVANDLLTLLLTGREPVERGLIQEEGDGFWSFPKDYPVRAARLSEAGGS
jgi:esterase/lipase superfamily enzyme